ncbi:MULTISPECIES: dual specificity protein phosphatase family protein [unclassified Acinetobacter]|uniref:dual specificity protein phosphatase family protein n=1 Tax=unclassified Acinetobacter TaxID=196816 RepID=UPI001C21C126|nr:MULTISPECIES: dual specificity protein phosphatase family protein [unclassified Acinetobacter]
MKICIFPILMSSCLLTGCMTTPALPDHQRPQHWGQSIHQDHNFHQISAFVYRSEQPSTKLIPLLKQHQIDVIINLRSRDRDSRVLSTEKFQLHHVPIHTWALDRGDLLKVMQLIQQAQQNNQKVLLHCYHGSDRTGASVAMYRIIFQNWSIEDAVQEMKHGGYGFHAIWRNIENLFSPENVKWIQEQLSNPSLKP